MSDKVAKPRKTSSKGPPQIVRFFSKSQTSNGTALASTSSTTTDSNRRKRKFTSENHSSSENENPNTYAETLQKSAEEISKVKKAKKTGTLVSTFFQQEDGLSDFESPNKRPQIKTPPVLPKKKTTRKRKQASNKNATKKKNAFEEEVFEKVLAHHSAADGLNSDDLQMAIALSRSLVDTHKSSDEFPNDIASVIRNAGPLQKEDIVRQTFQKFGFKKRDNNDYDFRDFFTNHQTKKKWMSKFTPLTRRNNNMQNEKFKWKVKSILQISENVEIVETPMPTYGVTSAYLEQFIMPESPLYEISLAELDTKVEDFYTNNLVPISTLKCGCLLKDWADIPGRDASPTRESVRTSNVDMPENVTSMKNEQEEIFNDEKSTQCQNWVSDSSPNAMEDHDEEFNRISNTEVHEEVESIEVIHSPPTNAVATSREVMENVIANIDIPARKIREQSPNMFSDYESSANNSFDDDDNCPITSPHFENNLNVSSSSVTSTNHTKVVDHLEADYVEEEHVEAEHLSPSENANIPHDASDNAENLIAKTVVVEERHSSQIDSSSISGNSESDRHGTNNDESPENEANERPKDAVSQCNVNDVISLSSDDSNEGHTVKRSEQVIQPTVTSSSIEINLQRKSLVISKHLSFTERLELYHSDPIFDAMDDMPLSSQMSQYSQDSIVISDDEINYSSRSRCNEEIMMPPQESIELSDSEELEVNATLSKDKIESKVLPRGEITSQLTGDEDEERESFLSVNVSNVSDSDSEKNIDLHFDDSNQSSNIDDLINLSVREICQKEFVSGSAKSSRNKSFSRTTSDMTFERKSAYYLNHFDKSNQPSDDELDEFDFLVKGRRVSQETPDKSFKFNDDLDELVSGQQSNISDELAELNSPQQCTHSNEFIVQSMDHLYEVKTGVAVTPKPDYNNMDSPTRLEHLKKYGLKNLSKRKAVICLEHIYNRLHPSIELDSHDHLGDILSQKNSCAGKFGNIEALQPNLLRSCMSSIAMNQNESEETNIVEDNFDILQENEDNFYLPSAPRAKKPWCLQPLHIAWHNLIRSNRTLSNHVLQYKPIDLIEIRLLFKSCDLRYETNDIISFLDRKCITFKTDNKRSNAIKKS